MFRTMFGLLASKEEWRSAGRYGYLYGVIWAGIAFNGYMLFRVRPSSLSEWWASGLTSGAAIGSLATILVVSLGLAILALRDRRRSDR